MTKRKSLSYLIEAELEKATVLLAAKAITNKLQQIAEQLAKVEAQDLMPLSDSMREMFGSEASTSFEETVSQKLRAVIEQVREARNEISDNIDALEKGEPMGDLNIGADDAFAADDGADMPAFDDEGSDDPDAMSTGQEAPLAGGDDMTDLDQAFDLGGAAGRPKKESFRNTKKIVEGSADYRLARQFSNLLREGHSVKQAVRKISEMYAIAPKVVADIIQMVKKG